MVPNITPADVAAAKRFLFQRSRSENSAVADFAVRPISEAWRYKDRRPAYRTAVANVAYIHRDADAVDQIGPMPPRFADRRCELHSAGLALPASAPAWATEPYRIWREADEAARATDDMTAVSAWHVMAQIPSSVPRRCWTPLAMTLIDQHLTARGAAVAHAIHSLEGVDGWIVRPHLHLIVTALRWRHDRQQGSRHPALGDGAAQHRLATHWRQLCRGAAWLI